MEKKTFRFCHLHHALQLNINGKIIIVIFINGLIKKFSSYSDLVLGFAIKGRNFLEYNLIRNLV